MILRIFKKQWRVIKATFQAYIGEHSFVHGAALSYYTLMALAPIIFLALLIFGSILGRDFIVENTRSLLSEVVGEQSIETIYIAIDHITINGLPWYMQIITLLTLIYTTTAVFNTLKININDVWNLKIEHKKQFFKAILDRLIALLALLIVGVTFILIFFAETVFISFNQMLYQNEWKSLSVLVITLEHLAAIALNSGLFFLMFKFLPDGKVKSKHVLIGSIFTATLFYLGQFLISWYLGSVTFVKDLGAAGAIMLILLWIYYSSQIVFLGATYIHELAIHEGYPILPKNNRFFNRKKK